jgi:hypothetical protein
MAVPPEARRGCNASLMRWVDDCVTLASPPSSITQKRTLAPPPPPFSTATVASSSTQLKAQRLTLTSVHRLLQLTDDFAQFDHGSTPLPRRRIHHARRYPSHRAIRPVTKPWLVSGLGANPKADGDLGSRPEPTPDRSVKPHELGRRLILANSLLPGPRRGDLPPGCRCRADKPIEHQRSDQRPPGAHSAIWPRQR